MPEKAGSALPSAKIAPIDFSRMRQERSARAQAALKKNGVAATLLFRLENIRYVTGSQPGAWIDRLGYTLAFAEHEPIQYHPETQFHIPYAGLQNAALVKSENVRISRYWANEIPGPEATREAAKIFASEIKADLKKMGLDKEKIGYDGFLDYPGLQALAEAGIQLFNAQPVMFEARAIKTQDEINCLRTAAAIADAGHYAMSQAIRPGIRRDEVAIVGINAMVRAGGEARGTGAFAPDISRVGDFISMDIAGPRYMGYNTCVYRNYVVGRKPTDKEKDLHNRSRERIYRVIDSIKPGATTADAAKHMKPAKEAGLPSEWSSWCDELGHGLGLSLYEYPIINRLWSLEHPMTFEKNMTMAVECMEYDPAIGRVKLEEMIAVTDTGVELLTRMPIQGIIVSGPVNIADD